MRLFNKPGFTIIEIMIVIAIIAIALAIAIPNYLHMTLTAKRTICIDNMKKITAEVSQWAIDNNITAGTAVTSEQENDMYSNYFRSGRPVCPLGGQYSISPIGENPQVRCSKEDQGHKL